MFRRAHPWLAAALLLAPLPAIAQTPGAVQAQQGRAMPGAEMPGPGMGRTTGRGGKLAGFFTPEEQAMFSLQNRDKLQAMPPDQRKAFRRQQIRNVLAMSETERQKLKSDLHAKWDALPPQQKNRLEHRIMLREGRQGGAQ